MEDINSFADVFEEEYVEESFKDNVNKILRSIQDFFKNMIKNQFDAVIFDLDGTLVDSMWVWEKVDETFLGQLGIEVPSDMNKDLENVIECIRKIVRKKVLA